jgi:hypothetical protein
MKKESEDQNPSGPDLEPAQQQAIEARLAGKNWTDAAEAAGVHRGVPGRVGGGDT